MPSDALMSTIQKSIDLVQQYAQAAEGRGDPRRRFSPTERLRGRELEPRQHRTALDQALAGIGDLREPIADALERASMDSTAWLRFIAAASQGEHIPSAEPVIELLQRLLRRARLGLLQE